MIYHETVLRVGKKMSAIVGCAPNSSAPPHDSLAQKPSRPGPCDGAGHKLGRRRQPQKSSRSSLSSAVNAAGPSSHLKCAFVKQTTYISLRFTLARFTLPASVGVYCAKDFQDCVAVTTEHLSCVTKSTHTACIFF